MRICLLCEGYPPARHGGIGTFTQNLARALVRAGHQVWVLGRYSKNFPAAVYEEDQGVAVWRYRIRGDIFSRARLRYELFRTVAAWSRSGKIDLVEAPDCAGWTAGWPRLPVPIVVRLHGSLTYLATELGQPLDRSAFLLEWAAFRRADFWCSVSRYAAHKTQRLFALPGDSGTILYNAVDMPLETPALTRSKNQVVFTGGLKVNKGILSLIQAWPRVIAVNPEAELHIFGSDRPTDNGQSMQAFLLSRLDVQVRRSVRFHGFGDRRQIFHALQTAHLAVFPSYAEAFSQAPMEAMACGCPTIYTRRTSGPELIEHDQTGLLVDPDRTDEIGNAIIRLLTDDTLARRLGEAGRKVINENFSIGVMVRQNEAFYEDCLKRFRRTPRRRTLPFWARGLRRAVLARNREPD
jgi:glycosyltransferase involved in cell wall biosynthesis